MPKARFGTRLCMLGAAIIAVGIVLTFWWLAADPSQPRFLGSGDAWAYYGPALHFLDHRIHDGEFPLWNPLYFCGQPHAANPQSWAFYPPNLLRSLLTFNPTPIKTHIGIAAMVFCHLLLGGVGAMLLARRHGQGFGASLVAACAFTLSAASVTRAAGHWIFLNVAAWLPLLLLLLNFALTGIGLRRKAGYTFAAGTVWSMAILGGVPNLILLTGLMAGTYCLLFRVLNPAAGVAIEPDEKREPRRKDKTRNRKQPARSRPERRSRFRPVARLLATDAAVLVVMFAAGTLIAFPLLFPLAEFAGFTGRADTGGEGEEDLVHVTAGWDLFKGLILYQGHGHYEGPRASGAGVLLLALVAILSRRRHRRDVVLFGGLFLIALDCSLSEPLLFGRVLKWAAPYKLSNPARAMILVCLPLGLLAGAGTDAALRPLARLRWRIGRTCLIAAAAGLLVLTIALAAWPEPVLSVGKAAAILPVAALCLVAGVGGWLPKPAVWGVAIAALVFGETLVWNRHLIPSVVTEGLRYPRPLSELKEPRIFEAGNRRRTDLNPNLLLYDLDAITNGYDPLHVRRVRNVLCAGGGDNAFRRMVFGAEATATNYRGNLFLKRPFWLARQYVDGPLPGARALYPVTTTAFLDAPGGLSVPRVERGMLPHVSVTEDSQVSIVKPRGSPPLTVRSEDVAGDDDLLKTQRIPLPPLHASLFIVLTCTCELELQPVFVEPDENRTEYGKKLTIKPTGEGARSFEVPLPDFDEVEMFFKLDFKDEAGRLTLLEMFIRSDRSDEDGLITVLSRRANEVVVELTELPGPRILLFVDAHYPGWRAYIDGERTPIFLANDAFKAVQVLPGTHRVRFVFKPWRVLAGVMVSAATLLAMLCLGALRHCPPRPLSPLPTP